MKRALSAIVLLLIAASAATAQELLPQLHKELAERTANDNGTTISFTRGNVLPPNWLLMTDDKPAHGAALRASLRSVIEKAQQTADVTFLGPPPEPKDSDLFAKDLRDALTALAATNRAVRVRILFAYPTGNFTWKTVELLQYLLGGARPGHRLTVSLAAMTAKDLVSWNHAKIVVADGKRVIVGGHNLYSDQYLGGKPVLDLSMLLEGPAAATAARFNAVLWRFAATYNRHGPLWNTFIVTYDPTDGKVTKDFGSSSWYEPPAAISGTGGVAVLAVSHLGVGVNSGLEPAAAAAWKGEGNPARQWSDDAMTWILARAKSVIRISQQDIVAGKFGARVTWNEPVMRVLGGAIQQGVDVRIMLSNAGAADYSSDVPYYNIARKIRTYMSGSEAERNARLHRHLQIAPAAIGSVDAPSRKWPDLTPVANHPKFYMADDRIFYIGSHNMYPPVLNTAGINQEFGFVIEDADAAKTLLETYWNPRWERSKPFVLTGLLTLKDHEAMNIVSIEPIANDDEARTKCPPTCSGTFGLQWNGYWWWFTAAGVTTSWCQCEPPAMLEAEQP